MAAKSKVALTDRTLTAKVACWGRDDWFRVSARRSIEDGSIEPVEVTWPGTSNRTIEEGEEFAGALGEALRCARWVRLICERPDTMRGDGQDMLLDFEQADDLRAAAFVFANGGELFYSSEGPESVRTVTSASSRVVDLAGLRDAAAAVWQERYEKANV